MNGMPAQPLGDDEQYLMDQLADVFADMDPMVLTDVVLQTVTPDMRMKATLAIDEVLGFLPQPGVNEDDL